MSDSVRDYQRAAQVRPFEGEIPANDDRLAQARAEAERRWPRKQSLDDPYPASRYRAMSVNRRIGFEQGVEWADAHPESTPEDLVAAYEEGQRDAVEKGMASPQPRTITRAEFLEALDAHVGLGASGDWVTVEDMLIAAFMAAGIEVRDE